MKIRIVSDLHLEFEHWQLPILDDEDQTTLILAGDIHVNSKLIRPFFVQKTNEYLDSYLEEYSKRFKNVIYVFGNHEYYSSSIDRLPIRLNEKIDEIGLTNIHILDIAEVIIDGVRFLGGTLWTNFSNRDPLCLWNAQRGMNDYRQIRIQNFKRKLQPSDTLHIHEKTIKFIDNKCKEEFDGKTVIVAHHAPSDQSIAACHKYDTLMNGCYFTALEEFIMDRPIDMFIHGHMHNTSDYTIGECRVICNPKGYPHELNQDFQDDLVIDL